MQEKNSIKRAFDFLYRHAQEKKPFSIAQFSTETEWSIAETKDNLINRLCDIVYEEGGKYFSKPEILRVRLADFSELLHQKKRLFTDYILEVSPSILIYEFFMPLSREDRLREALDNLFYRDTIEQRIQEIGISQIRDGLKLTPDYSEDNITQLIFRENAIIGKHPGMGSAAGDIIFVQPRIVMNRCCECFNRLGGRLFKASTPQFF